MVCQKMADWLRRRSRCFYMHVTSPAVACPVLVQWLSNRGFEGVSRLRGWTCPGQGWTCPLGFTPSTTGEVVLHTNFEGLAIP